MSITFLSHPIHLPDFFKFDREYLGKQESQNEDQKVFHKDILEVSQLSKNRENLMDKIKHTVVHSVTSFSDMRAGILKEIREEKKYPPWRMVGASSLNFLKVFVINRYFLYGFWGFIFALSVGHLRFLKFAKFYENEQLTGY